jgi:hypothetical protein
MNRASIEESERLAQDRDTKRTLLLNAALNALRSYQHGNPGTDLAKEVADTIEAHLSDGDPRGGEA